MLVQNLYENILIRQKLKTKQGNHIINSINYVVHYQMVKCEW